MNKFKDGFGNFIKVLHAKFVNKTRYYIVLIVVAVLVGGVITIGALAQSEEEPQVSLEGLQSNDVMSNKGSSDLSGSNQDSFNNLNGNDGTLSPSTADSPLPNDPEVNGSLNKKDRIVPATYNPKMVDLNTQEWNLVLVNGENCLPEGFTPTLKPLNSSYDFDERALPYLKQMLADAEKAGLSPVVCSAYRTYEKQETLFNKKVDKYLASGLDYEAAFNKAKMIVAYPGTSEHNLGLAVDIVSKNYRTLDAKQSETPEMKWLIENCSEYGFILRYPSDKTAITGIIFEPWHFRYVGVEVAKEITSQGVCLEEYLAGIPGTGANSSKNNNVDENTNEENTDEESINEENSNENKVETNLDNSDGIKPDDIVLDINSDLNENSLNENSLNDNNLNDNNLNDNGLNGDIEDNPDNSNDNSKPGPPENYPDNDTIESIDPELSSEV